MKKIMLAIVSIMLTMFSFNQCNSIDNGASASNISFYEVPLVCGADSTLGCGSRIKPLFIASGKQKEIKESWTNRPGTIVAFVWKDGKSDNDLVEKLFKQLEINASHITDETQITELTENMKGEQRWYEGMSVDSLSLFEAGVIAFKTTAAFTDAGLITEEEASAIRPEIESYYKKELVKVRTYEELCQDEKTKWLNDSYQIYASHIGTDRAEKVKSFYLEYLQTKEEKKSCKKSCEKKDCCKKG